MRDYSHLERYIDTLHADVYEQPPDPGHQAAIEEIAEKWLPMVEAESILDVGCGQGQAFKVLQRYARQVIGVTLGADVKICQVKRLEVYPFDMTFLTFPDEKFDLIFSRHSLEHSPMPLLTLMEWHRVARQWLILVVPKMETFGPGGRNHYYVLLPEQWQVLLTRAGWEVVIEDHDNPMEHRYLCRKL